MASGRQLRAPLLCGHEQQGAAASRGRGKQAIVEADTHTAALWLGPGERKEMALALSRRKTLLSKPGGLVKCAKPQDVL